jgi:hypothetical protein
MKKYPEGIAERYKVSFWAKGFTQVEGVDFKATFVPWRK